MSYKHSVMSNMEDSNRPDLTPALPTPVTGPAATAIITASKNRYGPIRKTLHSTSVVKDFAGTKRAVDSLLLDGRSSVAKQVALLEKAISNDLGGAQKLSTTKLALVSIVAREMLLLDLFDQFLFGRNYLVDKRRRRLTNGTHDRIKLADSVVKHMQALEGVK
jgi:hypothetical protein